MFAFTSHSLLSDFTNSQRVLLSAARRERRNSRHEAVDSREGNEVDGKRPQIAIELAHVTDARRHTADRSGHEVAQIFVGGNAQHLLHSVPMPKPMPPPRVARLEAIGGPSASFLNTSQTWVGGRQLRSAQARVAPRLVLPCMPQLPRRPDGSSALRCVAPPQLWAPSVEIRWPYPKWNLAGTSALPGNGAACRRQQ